MHSGTFSCSNRPKSSAPIVCGTSTTAAGPSAAMRPARTVAVSASWLHSAGLCSLNSTFGSRAPNDSATAFALLDRGEHLVAHRCGVAAHRRLQRALVGNDVVFVAAGDRAH